MATFYLDHDVDRGIATTLTHLGHEASTARDEGLAAADDDEHLLIAVRLDAILITHNFNDFRLLHSAWLRWTGFWHVTTPHPGILVIPQQRWSPVEAAEQITTFVGRDGEVLSNRMYRWRTSTGWYEIT